MFREKERERATESVIERIYLPHEKNKRVSFHGPFRSPFLFTLSLREANSRDDKSNKLL